MAIVDYRAGFFLLLIILLNFFPGNIQDLLAFFHDTLHKDLIILVKIIVIFVFTFNMSCYDVTAKTFPEYVSTMFVRGKVYLHHLIKGLKYSNHSRRKCTGDDFRNNILGGLYLNKLVSINCALEPKTEAVAKDCGDLTRTVFVVVDPPELEHGIFYDTVFDLPLLPNYSTSFYQGEGEKKYEGMKKTRRHGFSLLKRRLETFTNSKLSKDAKIFAQSGFFFCGKLDRVCCYECGIFLSQWEKEDDPLLEHFLHSPDCPLVVSLLPEDIRHDIQKQVQQSRRDESSNRRIGLRGNTKFSGTDLMDVELKDQITYKICMDQEMKQKGVKAMPDETYIITSSSLTSLYSYVGEILKSTNMDNTRERMKYEWVRYITFESFPRSSSVQPTILAQSGFYYSGTGDETICFSCGLKYRNWKQGDSPFDVHKKLSPKCDFVNCSGDGNMPMWRRGTDFVHSTSSLTSHEDKDKAVTRNNSVEKVNSNNRNENKDQTELFSAVDRTGNRKQSKNDMNEWNNELGSNSSFTSNSFVQENTKSSLSERPNVQPGMSQNNIKNAECLEKPKHQHYSALASRFESFKGWPSYPEQNPADLAAAGFYYAGVDDYVRCFFCGGGLRSWEEGDNPWEEHARWYPDCAFLKQYKGDNFVLSQLTGINSRSDEILKFKPRDNVISEQRYEHTPCHRTVSSDVREIDPEDPMDFPAAQNVLAMGYNTEMIRQAVHILTSRKGHAKFSTTDLIEIVFQLEEKQTKLYVTKDSDPSNGTVRVQADASMQYSISKPKDVSVNQNEKSDHDFQLSYNISAEEEKNDQSRNSSLSPGELKSLPEKDKERKDQMACKICMEEEACIVFLPCSHMMTCPHCAPAFRKCPVCRQLIRDTVRAYDL